MNSKIHYTTAPLTPMRAAPQEEAEQINEILYGEPLFPTSSREDNTSPPPPDWHYIKCNMGEYEGWVYGSVVKGKNAPTHHVAMPRTHAYAAPDFKTPNPVPLYFLSQIALTGKTQNGFSEIENGLWVFENHLAPLESIRKDHAETALMFLGTPYLWGGRSISGIDCSGLVQIVLQAAGHQNCPRDTSEQISSIGQPVEFGDTIGDAQISRGDFVFFEGHVGIMMNESEILNATSRHMSTLIEPLDILIEAYGGILAVRRV